VAGERCSRSLVDQLTGRIFARGFVLASVGPIWSLRRFVLDESPSQIGQVVIGRELLSQLLFGRWFWLPRGDLDPPHTVLEWRLKAVSIPVEATGRSRAVRGGEANAPATPGTLLGAGAFSGARAWLSSN